MMKASRIVNRVTAVSAIRRLAKPTCITGIRTWNVQNFSTQFQEHEHEWQEFSNSQTVEKNLKNNFLVSNVSSEPIRTSLLMELTDRVGVLHDVLRFFWKYDVNISRYVALMYLDMRTFELYLTDFFFFVGLSRDHRICKSLTSL